jgi:hypothetical protein
MVEYGAALRRQDPNLSPRAGPVMTTTVPVLPDLSGAAAPEERFWQRYSSHGELPLSGVGSLALHLLVVGLMLFWAYYLALFFTRPMQALPVEPVQLVNGDDKPASGASGLPGPKGKKGRDEVDTVTDGNPEVVTPVGPHPTLTGPNPEASRLPVDFKDKQPTTLRPEDLSAVGQLEQGAGRLRDGPNPGGNKQTGKTGSKDGTGPSTGASRPGQGGPGQGVADQGGQGRGRKLTEREKRMVRWSIHFNTTNGQEYLAQLRGLGAILAIPVAETPVGGVWQVQEYRIVRDLHAPARLLNEDIHKINRISWRDTKPLPVMQALGLPLRPSHFVAFMPRELEEKLAQMEKEHLQKDHPGLTEDEIEETNFQVVPEGGRYEPRFVSMQLKHPGRPPARP